MTRIQEADILLIDDNPDLLTLVSQALSNAGFATCARPKPAPRPAGRLRRVRPS